MKHCIGLEFVYPEINRPIIVKMGDNLKGCENNFKINISAWRHLLLLLVPALGHTLSPAVTPPPLFQQNFKFKTFPHENSRNGLGARSIMMGSMARMCTARPNPLFLDTLCGPTWLYDKLKVVRMTYPTTIIIDKHRTAKL